MSKAEYDFYNPRAGHICNICGRSAFIPFRDINNIPHEIEPICPNCGSYSRTRVVKLFIDRLVKLDKNCKIMHFAPEPGLYDWLESAAGENYEAYDLNPRHKNTRRIDLNYDLENFASNSYDLILHLHVFEHIPCNYAYLLYHIHRLLKRDGLHICCIPVCDGYYHENCDPELPGEYKETNFGQFDHIRKFGKEDIQEQLGKIIKLPRQYDLTDYFSKDELLRYAIRPDAWKGWSFNTILRLAKEDYILNSLGLSDADKSLPLKSRRQPKSVGPKFSVVERGFSNSKRLIRFIRKVLQRFKGKLLRHSKSEQPLILGEVSEIIKSEQVLSQGEISKFLKSKPPVFLPECLIPLYDLSDVSLDLTGILSAGYNDETIKLYMSDLYASETGVSSQAYDNIAMYQQIFTAALSQLRSANPSNAIEFGCGYGSATYAMAKIFPDMRILATELSLPMLQRHKAKGQADFPADKNIIRCQVNADESIFKEASCDLVFGTAILHHVLEPLKMIENIGKILRPNGIAIFCEPFEAGYGLLKLAYKLLLMLNKKGITKLDKKQKDYLARSIYIWDSMVFLPRSDGFFVGNDDKWLFPYNFFDDTARRAGFDIILKQPAFSASGMFKSIMNYHSTGNGVSLPPEAQELIALWDSAFTPAQLEAMPHDGVLIMQKSSANNGV